MWVWPQKKEVGGCSRHQRHLQEHSRSQNLLWGRGGGEEGEGRGGGATYYIMRFFFMYGTSIPPHSSNITSSIYEFVDSNASTVYTL